MAHELDFSLGRAGMAFTGDRKNIWHRHGQQMPEGATMAQWQNQAGLNWTAEKIPAYAEFNGRLDIVPNAHFLRRSDTQAIVSDGTVTDTYRAHQPVEFFEFTDRFVSVDDRFKMSAAGSLFGGRRLWITVKFNGDMTVAGDKHKAYLLATTSFDATMATLLAATMIRTVCNNTLIGALSDAGKGRIVVRHNTAFDKDRAAKQLAAVVASFSRFKAMGDAMAQVQMSRDQVGAFFRQVLDIPEEAKTDLSKTSTRKANQFSALIDAYKTTLTEGAAPGSVWASLQAVTRYVDHDRSPRGGDDVDAARFASANFGSGEALKNKAFGLLLPFIKDKVAA